MFLLHILLLTATIGVAITARFKVLYEWNLIDYTWPTTNAKLVASNIGLYRPENIAISGLKYHNNYLYITLPRMRQGVSATLARMPYQPNENEPNDTSPPLEPYPSWKLNQVGYCKALQNVQNTEIDNENLIWILDSGSTNTLTQQRTSCPPKLLIHNLVTNTTITSYTFPDESLGRGGFLYDIVVDKTNGDFAYITDNSVSDPGLIVFSRRANKSWKIRDATMRADPDATAFIVNGTSISSPVNIASIAFNPHTNLVYFAPLSSRRLYVINAKYLQDEHVIDVTNYISEVGRRASQSDGMVVDENGVMYYGLLAANSIAKWNTTLPFVTDQKVIARDQMFIQWTNSLTFDDAGNLLVITNRLQKLIYDKYDVREGNFRILGSNVGARSYIYATHNIEVNTNRAFVELTSEEQRSNNDNINSTLGSGAEIIKIALFLFIFTLPVLLLL